MSAPLLLRAMLHRARGILTPGADLKSLAPESFPASSPFSLFDTRSSQNLAFNSHVIQIASCFLVRPPSVRDSCLSVLLISLIRQSPSPHRPLSPPLTHSSPSTKQGGEDTRPSREDPAPRFSELYRSGPVTSLSSLIPHRQADR